MIVEPEVVGEFASGSHEAFHKIFTEKQRICRFVRLKATFVLTLDKSLGTGTYAKKKPPFCGTFPRVLC